MMQRVMYLCAIVQGSALCAFMHLCIKTTFRLPYHATTTFLPLLPLLNSVTLQLSYVTKDTVSTTQTMNHAHTRIASAHKLFTHAAATATATATTVTAAVASN